MATDVVVTIEDRPGVLAGIGEAAGKAGVNIDGVCCTVAGDRAVGHFLVEDAASFRTAVQDAGYTVEGEREVVVVSLEDRPGSLGEAARKIADAGANIEVCYLATNTRLVIGADDMGKVRGAL